MAAAVDGQQDVADELTLRHVSVDLFAADGLSQLYSLRISSVIGRWHVVSVAVHEVTQNLALPVLYYAAVVLDLPAIAVTLPFHFFHISFAIDTCCAKFVHAVAMLSYR